MTLVRKSLVSIGGTGLVAATGLIIGILLARWLLPDGLGQYGLVASTCTLTGVLASLGMGQATIYFVNNRGVDETVATTVVLRCTGVLALLLFGVLFFVFGYQAYFGPLTTWARVGAGLYGSSFLLVTAAAPILVAAMEIKRYVFVNVTPNFIFLALFGGSAVFASASLEIALLAVGLGHALAVVLAIWFLRSQIARAVAGKWALLRSIIIYGILLNLAYVTHLMFLELGFFMVRGLAGDFGEVGQYRAALKLSVVTLMIVNAIGPLLYSKYAAAETKRRLRQVERTCRILWVTILLPVVVLELAATPLVLLLLGSEYLPAVPVLQVLLIGMLARAAASPLLQLFSSAGSPGWSSAVLGLGVAVMTILMVVLIPKTGAVGAAVAFAIGNVVALVAVYIVSHFRFGIVLGDCFLFTVADAHFLIRNLKAPTVTAE